MLYCEKCKKEVVAYSMTPASVVATRQMEEEAEAEGKLIMFNIPPVRPYHCPQCGTELIDK